MGTVVGLLRRSIPQMERIPTAIVAGKDGTMYPAELIGRIRDSGHTY